MGLQLFTKQNGRPGKTGFRGALAAMLLGALFFATGAMATGLSGTYTIDASGSGNYTTFKGAVADLNTYGVSGPVLFKVTSATYAEVVTVGAITGASATNTITFSGKGRGSTTISSSGTTVTMKAYTTFDQMTILSSSSGSNLVNASSSTKCGLTNCNLIMGVGSTSSYCVYASLSNSLTVNNCELYGGGYGIYSVGANASALYGHLRFTRNRVVQQGNAGIYIIYDYLDSVAFNTVDSAAGSNYEYSALQELANGFVFWGNKIFAGGFEEVLFEEQDVDQVPNVPATQSYTVNNWIVAPSGGPSTFYALFDIPEFSPNYTVAFNTIVNFGATSIAVLEEPFDAPNFTFANNLIWQDNSTTSYTMEMICSGGTIKLMDGNSYNIGSGGGIIFENPSSSTSSYSTGSGYISGVASQGYELHSTASSGSPPFLSLNYPYDLHLSTTKAAPKGVSGLGFSTDIDGKGRFPSPTPGACESLYGIVKDNTGVIALVSPIAACPGTATVSVTLANLGLNAVSGGTVAWSWNGTPQSSVSYSTSIPLYGSITLTLGTVTLSAGVSNILKAWPTLTSGNPNAGGSIDTLVQTGILPALGAGTYTIDASKSASSTNFKTFASAVTALNAGVCGPVVFNVSAATYSEAINIGRVVGASAINTVTFHGAGRTKTTLTSVGNTVKLSGSSYVGFNNMTISTSGSGAVHDITDAGSSFCSLASCNLTSPNYTTNTGYVINSTGSFMTIKNCRLSGGQYSFYASCSFDSFIHNKIINMGAAAIYAPSAARGNDYEYNVVDSVAYASPTYMVYSDVEAGGNYNANYFYGRNSSGSLVTIAEPLFIIEPNLNTVQLPGTSVSLPWNFTNNIVQTQASIYDLIEILEQKALVNFSFNTIMNNGGSNAGIENIIEICPSNSTIWASNVFIMNNSGNYGYYMFTSTPGFVSGNPLYDGGDTLYDGNDIVVNNPSSNWGLMNSAVQSYASYLSIARAQGYERHGTNITPPFLNTGSTPLYLDTTKASPLGVYTGVKTDITGKKRCTLFPTAGAFEDPFGKAAKKTKIFVPSTGIYPGSPATIYQSHATGDPAIYTWYIENSNYNTWTPLASTVDLYYSGWTTGTNKLKLVSQACSGFDSDSVAIVVTAPNAVPVTDFIATSNSIQQNTFDQLTDLSTNGPTKWLWEISPDSTTIGTVKVPTTNQYNGSPALNTTQNPSIQFLYPGFYKVCLTAYNGLGKGAKTCKTNYIDVVPATNLGPKPQTVTDPKGYIFDNGGPNANYTSVASPYFESVLIQPCADSIYLTFSQFDTKCGTDFVKLFNGSTPAPSTQIGLCNTNTGTNSIGPGFNGGSTNSGCPAYCVPNVNKPDTFKAGKTMLLQMACYSGGAPGFAAYYWVKPSSDKKVAPTFATSTGSTTVCEGQLITFSNTTTLDPKDPPTFEWDLNGTLADGFECVGACATAQWPYFLPGTVPVTLIAINCGGADTLVKNITVISPPKPVAAFSADIIAPTLADVVTFTSGTVQCVDAYLWKITASAGTLGGAAAVFVNGTNDTSASPMVTFPDTGYYDVSLTVTNASGSQTNTKTVLRYIHVREPYCQPSVASLSSGIGINHVVFNTIDNYTTPQATSGYLNFTANSALSTNIAVGASYNLAVSRDQNSIFSPINRDAWIDYNQDGFFTGTGENVLKDSNTTNGTSTAKVTVPTTAKIGATVLRIAVNLYLYPNAPCGPNSFGEYEDYRVYVTPYNILPVITLKGLDTIVVEQGYPFTLPGDSASSYLYGDITSSIVITSQGLPPLPGGSVFSILVPGTYLFTYNVTDASGNKAVPKTRVVIVTPDKTAPDLILSKNSVSGTDTIYQEVSTAVTPPNLIPSLGSYVVSSIDLVDGNLTGSVIVDSSLVQLNVVGIYPVTYTSTDLSKNTIGKTIYVDVIDTFKPVLTIKGANPDTIEVYTPFVDPGVSLSVSNGYLSQAQMIHYLHVTSSVNDSVLGTYKVIYSLTDTFGNVAKPVTRIVVVADKLAPVLTLLGPGHDSVLVNNTYYDRGYTVSDNFSKAANIKVTLSGTFVTSFKNNFANKLGGGRDSAKIGQGNYRLTYTAIDGSGNKSTVTRFIEVYDNIAPVISLIGNIEVNVCRWFPYTDLGYTLSDNFNDSASMVKNVKEHGTLLTKGTSDPDVDVYLYYTVTDQAGNTGKSEVRTVHVLPDNYFSCASGIQPGLGLDKYISVFPNPGSGIFNVEANLPTEQHVRIIVSNMLGQELMVVHDGNLLNNNFRIDLSNQASGVYFLNIISDAQNLTKRIEISK